MLTIFLQNAAAVNAAAAHGKFAMVNFGELPPCVGELCLLAAL
jgi:hypothetical protein